VSTRQHVDGQVIKRRSKNRFTHAQQPETTVTVVPGSRRPNAAVRRSTTAELSRTQSRARPTHVTGSHADSRLGRTPRTGPANAWPSRRGEEQGGPTLGVAEHDAKRLCFENLFVSERHRLFAVLCGVLGDPGEAEEVEQEAFVRVLERWDRVAGMADPVGYLYRVALNVFRSRFRRARVAATVVFAERQSDEIAAIDDRDLVIRMLTTLSPRQRAAIILTSAFGYSSEEAGAILGIQASSIRVLTSRGRAVIRRRSEEGG
jgi:RNA polymerase sigma-70 factor, ECF subfamily